MVVFFSGLNSIMGGERRECSYVMVGGVFVDSASEHCMDVEMYGFNG